MLFSSFPEFLRSSLPVRECPRHFLLSDGLREVVALDFDVDAQVAGGDRLGLDLERLAFFGGQARERREGDRLAANLVRRRALCVGRL